MLPIWQDSPASRRLHHLREVGLRYRLFEAGVGLAARAIGTDTRVRSQRSAVGTPVRHVTCGL
jgi:hypothetical protein